ncbi:MAG TPA: hypothetical protein DCY00_00575 [Actinobacteria bacterium]|nr:hypothetical protein [Actinomycetota bacterium]
MLKRKKITIASTAIGIAMVGMLAFAAPLLGADKSPDLQSSSTTSAEEVIVGNDTDTIKEEVAKENEAEDTLEAGGAEEANESSDIKEADENLPGGGHEDPEGIEVDHQFEGVE